MKTVNDLPIEIKEKMMDEQEAQGNKRDWSVFEKAKYSAVSYGGFNWDKTELGHDNWATIILNHYYEPFYKQYPQNTTEICKIEAKLKQLQKRVDELKNKEKIFFVPKEIGFFIVNKKFRLIFNNEKSIFYSKNNLFNIETNDINWRNDNTGDNIELIKKTFKEIEDGSFFLDNINKINNLAFYFIKKGNRCYCVQYNNIKWYPTINEMGEVYELKLIK